jgi:DNA repair protein RAD57
VGGRTDVSLLTCQPSIHPSDHQPTPRSHARCCCLQMTNLLTVLPDFDIKPYSHILPSLEKALVSTADLISIDAFDVAKRAQVPVGEVRRLADALLAALHAGLREAKHSAYGSSQDGTENGQLASVKDSSWISTLDDSLDVHLGGGVAPGLLTEIVGERYGTTDQVENGLILIT